jgi:Flp pilus assembly protein TadG
VSLGARLQDERGLVGKALVILMLVVLFLGIVVVETGSIVFTKLSLENTAEAAAADGARDLATSHNRNSACEAAAISVVEHDKNAVLKNCDANLTTGTVFIRLRKDASTLIVQHIGFLEKLAIVKATAETGPGKV